jgi:hypothetical protein
MTDRAGVAFDHTSFQPIVIVDADGASHSFKIRSMFVPTGHEMEALEILGEGRLGYQFRVLGDAEADAWELFQQLHDRMRRAMAVRHVERTEYGWQVTQDRRLVGRIEWDPDEGGAVPEIVIDGTPFSWQEVGRMLMTFEGFTLTAQIDDTIELVEGAPRRIAKKHDRLSDGVRVGGDELAKSAKAPRKDTPNAARVPGKRRAARRRH